VGLASAWLGMIDIQECMFGFVKAMADMVVEYDDYDDRG
jgi:hypothetical protein